ncbi:MAG: TonB family protein [Prevotella sp.]|nr:TonB family protein [Prevotella sp.]
MLLVYQLKVGICLIAFYLVWKLLLSRETLHHFNRVLLLTVTALALVLPWVKLTLDHPSPVGEGLISIEDLLAVPLADAASQAEASWNILRVTYIIYIVGVVGMLLWNLHNVLSLRRLLRRGRVEQLPDGDRLHVMTGDMMPFSYFRHIVISEKDMREASREILAHEQAHIHLGHSYDVLFVDVVLLFQWWNPAAWLLRRELKQIHEFEADEAVLQRGVDAQQYQLLLIRKSVGDQLFSMANNLNYQSLKKRIRMMTTKRSSRWQQLRALTVVPVAALAVVAFARPEVETVVGQIEEQAVLPAPAVTQVVPESGAVSIVKPEMPADTSAVFEVVEQMPKFPGGDAALMQFLSSTIKYPKDAMEQKKQGRVLVTFVVEKDGSVSDTKVVRSVFPSLDEEALRVIKAMPKWEPGMQKGKTVRVKYTIPISFRLQGGEKKDESQTKPLTIIHKGDAPAGENPLVIIDGKEVSIATLQTLDNEKIESINVLKDKSAVDVYGEKGKNGVIEIKLKKK